MSRSLRNREDWGKGGENFLQKVLSSLPPTPILPLSKTFDVIESLLASFPVNIGVRLCFSSYNEKRRRKKSFAFLFPIRNLSYPSSFAHAGISDEGFDKDESLWRGRGEVWRGEGGPFSRKVPLPQPQTHNTHITSAEGARSREALRTWLPSGPAPWDSCSEARRSHSRL